jgi:glutamyl-tRNA synthetase
MERKPVRTRIAPSPTGDPHVGTGYIALFNYAFAKQSGGQFILRIEDTDRVRSNSQSEEAIFESLRWLGIEWSEGPDCGGDKGPYRQSERLSIYKEYGAELVRSKQAYWCSCTPERLADMRERQKQAKSAYGYDGHCRDRDPDEVQKEIDGGAPGVIRLRTPPDGQTIVKDALRGDIVFENSEIDDQVLQKSDGYPTYHLANIVDDHLMEITHVIRGEEWITSSPKHVLLYKAFGWETPVFAHLPLLRNSDKSKVSKRKNPVSLSYFKEAGYLPDAMANFLGQMAFTFEDEREVFSIDEFVEHFQLEKIVLGGPVFDLQKLLWLNGRYLREKRSVDDFSGYLRGQVFPDHYLEAIAPLVHERIDKSEDFMAYAQFFFTGSVETDPGQLLLKGRTKKECTKIYEKLLDAIDSQMDFSPEGIENRLRQFCEERELKSRDVFMPVRLMVTGQKATPPLFQTISVLGRERCRKRVREALIGFKAWKPPQS